MTQSSKPWDGISLGDATEAPYSSNEWAHIWNMLHGVGAIFPNYGIIPGTGDGTSDPLQVRATTIASTNVQVHIGAALVNGKLYESDAAELLAVGANASGNPRIDMVVLRVDYTAQTIRLVLKQGTPAASPVAPSLTQSASLWEIPLADIAIANGFSTITRSEIKDRRRSIHSTIQGWQPYAYGLCHIPNGAYNGSLQSVNTVAVPFTIAGNMLVQQITFIPGQTSSTAIDWGIYVEDLNDENASHAVVRLLGGRVGAGNSAVVAGSAVSIPAVPAPVFLTPGSYWLVIYFGGAFAMPSIIPTTLDANTSKAKISTVFAPITQTIDLGATSPYTESTLSFGVRLDGRVLGEATAF